MNFIQHPSNNLRLGAPEGHDHSKLPVLTLPVTRTEIEGVTCVQSYWAPDADEMAALVAGAPVVLSIMGSTMPPVMLGVEASAPTPQASDDAIVIAIKNAILPIIRRMPTNERRSEAASFVLAMGYELLRGIEGDEFMRGWLDEAEVDLASGAPRVILVDPH